jgi:hypothetical protein
MIVYVVTGTGTKYEPNTVDVIGVYTTRQLAQEVYDKIVNDYDDRDICAVKLDDDEV